MSKSAASAPGKTPDFTVPAGSDKLELPIDPEFLSLPPKVDLQAMLKRIEENMPYRSSRPGERERRAAMMVDVEFVL